MCQPTPDADTEALVRTTEELVGHRSVNPGGTEASVAEYLRERFHASPVPFDVETEEVFEDRPNVVARAGDPGRGSVLLTGHTDVVPADPADWTGDPFTLRRAGDRLVGRGAADMKGAIAAQLLAAETYLRESDAPGEVILAFVVDEEAGGSGTEALVEGGIAADCAIIGEPTELDVCTAQFGCARYRIRARGRSVHAGRPQRGENPIDDIAPLLSSLETLDAEMAAHEHPLLRTGSATATEVRAGIAHNVVPNELTVTVDWRFPPGISDSPAWFDARLEDAIATHAPGARTEIERYDFYPAIEIDRAEPVVGLLQSAAAAAGHQADVAGFPAGSDARFLVPRAGIPTVLFGPGSITRDAHTVDESVAVRDLEIAAGTYLGVLGSFFE